MSDKSIEDLSQIFNPVIRGWNTYYQILQDCALTCILPTQRLVEEVGDEEIQEAARENATGEALVEAHCAPPEISVRTLGF